MLEVWNDWQKLRERLNGIAPKSVGDAIVVSDTFVSMATQVEAILSTTLSIWLACVLVVLIVIVCTGSIQMAILILINLVFIVVFVIAGLAYLEMEFGGVEAIALTVLIGMSCDYCLHLSDTFLTSRSKSRCKRIKDSIHHLGPTIISAAGTSLLASIPTALFCQILILNNFGTIMCLSIVSGVLFGLLFFCPLCILFGPRFAGKTWKDTVMLSIIGSPLHGVTSIFFFTFLVVSLMEGPRATMIANPIVAAVLSLAALISPLLVGINISPAPLFRQTAVMLRY